METHTVATVDYVIAALYVLATAGFGAWFVRRSNTMEGFTLAGELLISAVSAFLPIPVKAMLPTGGHLYFH